MKRSTLSRFYASVVALSALAAPAFAGTEPVLSNRVIRADAPAEINQAAEPASEAEATFVPSETPPSRRPYHHEGLLLSKMQ